MNYIALTSLRSHWGAPKETILLGNPCTMGMDALERAQYKAVVNTAHFIERKACLDTKAYCDALSEKVLPHIAELLENQFALSYTQRFYERFLYPWLIHFIQALYDRYLSVVKAHAEYPEAVFITAPKGSVLYPVRDTMSYLVHFSQLPLYNLYVYSQIIDFLGYPQEERCAPLLDAEIVLFGGAEEGGLKEKIKKILKIAHKQYAICKAIVLRKKIHYLYGVYGCGSLQDVLRFGQGRWIHGSHSVRLSDVIINHALRNTSIDCGEGEFERLLGAMAMRFLPFGMCECLPELVQWAKKQSFPRAGVIATSVGMYADLPLMVLVGVKNLPLAVVEHGAPGMRGNYDIKVKVQERVTDRYFATGSNQYNLPSPYLGSEACVRQISVPVLVCSDYMPLFVRCEGGRYNDPQDYHEWRKQFLRAIPAHIYPVIRPYFRKFSGGNLQEILPKEFLGLHVQDPYTVPMEKVLADSVLVILDHPGTTLSRALATNTPVLVFSPFSALHYSDEGQEMIDRLCTVNIWHETPESAAAFYQSLIPASCTSWAQAKTSIDTWWFSAETQKVRNVFCQKYAQTSPNWAKEWMQAFDKLAHDGARKKAICE